MATKRITQTLKAPTRRFAELLAAALVGFYLLACLALYINAGDARWEHWIKIFEAFGPLVGLAVGWVFGKEVHRQAAEDARADANKGQQLAGAIRQAHADYRKASDATGAETAAGTRGDATSSMSFHLESLADTADELFGGR